MQLSSNITLSYIVVGANVDVEWRQSTSSSYSSSFASPLVIFLSSSAIVICDPNNIVVCHYRKYNWNVKIIFFLSFMYFDW